MRRELMLKKDKLKNRIKHLMDKSYAGLYEGEIGLMKSLILIETAVDTMIHDYQLYKLADRVLDAVLDYNNKT